LFGGDLVSFSGLMGGLVDLFLWVRTPTAISLALG
jgi:hypothetical protein